ncbi:MAG TPA: acetate--CoA ligase family protein, partial [Acidimicrobiales bacterium]|nr:acetate--CoA ligase family protein [Acidimicrobiales bacterium]
AGIWRARSTGELLGATDLYLRGGQPSGRRLAVVSNSGAACVLAADAAAEHRLVMANVSGATTAALEGALPPFASRTNPVDITAALLSDSSLVGKVLSPMADDPGIDACMLALPVSGRGYDYPRFAADAAEFAVKAGKPLVVTTPQAAVAQAFAEAGCAVFEEEYAAVGALAQYVAHAERRAEARPRRPLSRRRPQPGTETLDESDSLDLLCGLGLPTVPHVRCTDPAAAVAAYERIGRPVVVKGCSAETTHKSELGLVHLALDDAAAVAVAAADCLARMAAAGITTARVLVAPMVSGVREVLLGAHLDPVFGPVVAVGAGGKYVEAVPDVALLLPPFDGDDVLVAVQGLSLAPLLAGVRGEPPATVGAWAGAAVRLGEAMANPGCTLESVDANPYLLAARGEGEGVVVDAVVQVGRSA